MLFISQSLPEQLRRAAAQGLKEASHLHKQIILSPPQTQGALIKIGTKIREGKYSKNGKEEGTPVFSISVTGHFGEVLSGTSMHAVVSPDNVS